jgi:hypothetical protein
MGSRLNSARGESLASPFTRTRPAPPPQIGRPLQLDARLDPTAHACRETHHRNIAKTAVSNSGCRISAADLRLGFFAQQGSRKKARR